MYRSKGYHKMPTVFRECFRNDPDAMATVTGSEDYPELGGRVWFYGTEDGVLVVSELWGLPVWESACGNSVFGFHIHEGACCGGNGEDPFADVGGHYNPDGCEHPQHAGDLPPLFGNNGYALSAVLTDRVQLRDILGRTVIVHSSADDFHTQPSGNSGAKIACGEIRTYRR